VNESKCF